jgi:putative transcriptional regulator
MSTHQSCLTESPNVDVVSGAVDTQSLSTARTKNATTTAYMKDLIIDILSNKIREFRFRNGEMTQKTLAERVGVSRQTMNAIENCRHAPTIAVAIRMADVFSVSVDQLFYLEYEGKPARREQAPTVAIDRPEATVRESIKPEVQRELSEQAPKREFSLADLRHVVGR